MRGTAWIGLRLGLLLDYVNLEIIVGPVAGLHTLAEVNLDVRLLIISMRDGACMLAPKKGVSERQ